MIAVQQSLTEKIRARRGKEGRAENKNYEKSEPNGFTVSRRCENGSFRFSLFFKDLEAHVSFVKVNDGRCTAHHYAQGNIFNTPDKQLRPNQEFMAHQAN